MTTKRRFSLAKMFLAVLAISILFGALRLGWGLLIQHSALQKEAILQAQRRELAKIGVRMSVDGNALLPIQLDFTDASVGCDWLIPRLKHWEYSKVQIVVIDSERYLSNDCDEVKKRFPQIIILNGGVRRETSTEGREFGLPKEMKLVR